jgi:hypothetical protein
MSRQLELRNTIHRCKWCRRELTNPKSIERGAGRECYKIEVLAENDYGYVLDKFNGYLNGLCGKADNPVSEEVFQSSDKNG